MIGTDDKKQAEAPSNLFLVRVRATKTDGEEQWCGRVQHVISGKAYTFCDLETLVDLMVAMQHQVAAQSGADAGEAAGFERGNQDDGRDAQRQGGGTMVHPRHHPGLPS